ncbi:MAG: RNA methyltransferase [Bacteroidaceae bacterium]|nr:RNA methyltransferase [Bacteroidaceae bacterium]
MKEFEMIAKTFQGLEGILAEELTQLGANNIEIGRRVVSYTGDKELLYRSNFALRTAIKILKPIKHFHATSADEVYEAVKAIDWTDYLSNDVTFAVDSVVFSTEFRHSKFVAYKVKDAIVDQFREKTGDRPNISVSNPDLQLHIHVAEYDCTLSLDSSGESLHRRGYRQEAVEAPLNEVLAAGIILMTGWRGEKDFIDPMCGSGTLPIEAALIAKNIAPGVYRKGYAFEKWADFDAELFERVYNDDSQEREFTHKIYGYDNNREAVALSTRNVKAAGLSGDVSIEFQDFADFRQPAEPALMVTNPPYGERISSPDLLGLYKMIGQQLKHQFQDNEAWVLSYREECIEAIGLKPSLKTPLYNGALECELRKYQLFSGKYADARAEGREIKSDDDRKQMAQKHRFKERRNFKQGLDESDEEFEARFERRPRHFGDGDDDRRGYRRQQGERREFRRDGDRRDFQRDGDRRNFRGRDRRNDGDRRDFKRDGERRDFGKKGDFKRDGDRRDFGKKGEYNDRRERQEERRRAFGGKRDFKDRRHDD